MAADGLSVARGIWPWDVRESAGARRACPAPAPKPHNLKITGKLAGSSPAPAAGAAPATLQFVFPVSGMLKGFGQAGGTLTLLVESSGKRRATSGTLFAGHDRRLRNRVAGL